MPRTLSDIDCLIVTFVKLQVFQVSSGWWIAHIFAITNHTFCCDVRVCSLRAYVTWTRDDVGTSTFAVTRPSSSSSQHPVQHRALVVVYLSCTVFVRRVCKLVNWLKSSTWRYCDTCVYCKLYRECLFKWYCKAARIRMVYIILCLLMIYVYDYVMFCQMIYSDWISDVLRIILYYYCIDMSCHTPNDGDVGNCTVKCHFVLLYNIWLSYKEGGM